MIGKKALLRATVSASLLAVSMAIVPAPAAAQPMAYQLRDMSLSRALREFGRVSGRQIIFTENLVRGRRAPALVGVFAPEEALGRLLAGSGLRADRTPAGAYMIVRDQAAPGGVQATPGSGEGLAGSAPAESESAPDQEIVVTGTNIRGVSPLSPLITIDRSEIERTGVTSAQEVLRTVPQAFAGGVSPGIAIARANDGTVNQDRSAAANLRGLGSQGTLTLINGRRVAPASYGQFVDISAIPISAIERVEILTDGASASYGSDAIAGVVNFVLRRRYQGAETQVRYGMAPGTDYDDFNVSQLFGVNWNRGSALLTYDYHESGTLLSNDRAAASNLIAGAPLLYPSKRHALFGSLEQDLSSAVQIFATGYFTTRTSRNVGLSPLANIELTGSRRTRAFSGVAGLRAGIGGDWQVEGAYLRAESWTDTRDNVPVRNQASGVDTHSLLNSVDIRFDGPALQLPGGPLRVALGGSYNSLSSDVRSINFITNVSRLLLDRDRQNAAAFVEILAPLIGAPNRRLGLYELQFSGSLRHERYSDFGTTTNTKVALAYRPIEVLGFSGTYGTAFRAPDLLNLASSRNVYLDYLPDPSTLPGNERRTILFVDGANPDLKAETARVWTLSANLRPASRLNFDVTYYNISYRGRVAAPATVVGDILLFPETYGSFIQRNPTSAQVQAIIAQSSTGTFTDFTGFRPGGPRPVSEVSAVLFNQLQNLAQSEADGIDFRAAWSTEFGRARLQLGANINYILNQEDAPISGVPPQDQFNRTYRPSRLAGRSSASLSTGPFSASWFANFRRGYPDTYAPLRGVGERRVSDVLTHDIAVQFRGAGEESGFLSRIDVTLSIQNLFNRRAPLAYAQNAGFEPDYDPSNFDIRQRYVSLSTRVRW